MKPAKDLHTELENLTDVIQDLKTDISRTEGKLEVIIDELKSEHGISSTKDLKKKLKEAQIKETEAEAELAEALERFNKKYRENE